ncbi:hypothetical protein CEXT_320761 [Caerostris extrusa]|uniref:Uncharacterized protein n=1 Tax=Caerostris extrusa TaxID=172846 RepID=A0AAV4W5R3_CAEEX|nr:hypothetical protein CEXT_320761 [Caerostris extrusa]
METIPFPDFFSRSNFFKVMWNFPKFLLPSFLCFNLVIQIMWMCFISIAKDEWAALMILCLQLWIHISVFRSRTRIRLLTEDLYRISNMLHAYTPEKEDVEDLHLDVLFIRDFENCILRSDVFQIWNDSLRTARTAGFRNNTCTLTRKICELFIRLFSFHLLLANGFFALLAGYYCFYFVLLMMTLPPAAAANQAAATAREIVLSFPVVDILASLFWFGYSFAFPPNVNKVRGLLVQYFALLLIILIPGAAANHAAATAR